MGDQAEAEAEPIPAIKFPAISLPNQDRACANCHLSAKEGKDRVCRRNPPHTAMFMVPVMQPAIFGKPAQQGMQLTSQTWFPMVKDDQWCGEFKPRNSG